MSERKDYARRRDVELPPLENRRPHYAELRFDPLHGQITDFCVGYKVWCAGDFVEIVRYDSAHGVFHRHAAGYPEPGPEEERFAGIPMNQRGHFAVAHIKRNCERWQTVIPIEMREEEQEP